MLDRPLLGFCVVVENDLCLVSGSKLARFLGRSVEIDLIVEWIDLFIVWVVVVEIDSAFGREPQISRF